MEIYKQYKQETLSYLKTVGELRQKWKYDLPSWIDIATITLITELPCELNIETIQTAFNNGPVIIEDNGYPFIFNKHDSKFYNQISISHDDIKYGKRKVIKLFPNGKIHVAGCFHLIDCYRIINLVCKIITKLTGLVINEKLIKYNIAMINTSFSLNYIVNQKKIINIFNQKGSQFKVAFNPDRYAGVKIKFKPEPDMKCVTASIFSTGKILLSGANNLKEVACAYDIIVNTLYKNRKDVKVENIMNPLVDHIFMGYTMETWMKEGVIPSTIKSW